jgi:hypothetical protein
MTGYVKSVRHAASDRRIESRLKRHAELMDELIAKGLARDVASHRAMNLLKAEERFDPAENSGK